ncbi:MAG: hypothetical protein E7Z91_02440 [Cyanobacteria bacterium SIG30]|nr:hypothetical protein [Cyanobacteria bacterium SIG30]
MRINSIINFKVIKTFPRNNYPKNNLVSYDSFSFKGLENDKQSDRIIFNKGVKPMDTKGYELNLTTEELRKRTHKDFLATKKMLDVDSVEYNSLDEGDKKALYHLLKAALIIEKINYQLDSIHNLPFKKYLEEEIERGNENAKLTKILFDAQKGIFAIDRESNRISLAKNHKEMKGKGLYPEDLSIEEFHNILIKMLSDNKKDDVEKILNQRSIVQRCGDILTSTDYVDYFKDDFMKVADELIEASKYSTNSDFNEYLILQAKAFREADPMLDAYADEKWATLQDTPLEFTITRESYQDEMTETVFENEELKKLLDKYNIVPTSKDFLGGRVGIVNKKGTEAILKVKEFLPLMAENMPHKDEYVQNISPDSDSKQTMIDADLLALLGNVGEFRAGITLAENLPNDDKLSIKVLNAGRRNVYHRQIRMATSDDAKEKIQKRLNVMLNPELHKYYNDEADHWFTIGHENGHSLGPNSNTEGLGKYKSIIEENKADMVSLAMLDVLTDAGLYTEDERKQIIVTYATDNILVSKPTMSQAHRVRSVMQTYYFIKEGAISISKDGILDVDIDKMVPTAKKMLNEIIEIQMKNDFETGEKYVLDNFVWTDEMQKSADNIKQVSKTLNGRVESPLADYLLSR